jgi:hypothetical protein
MKISLGCVYENKYVFLFYPHWKNSNSNSKEFYSEITVLVSGTQAHYNTLECYIA